ncbi:MAG: hypothetical protein ACTSQ4_05250 [Candidatus Heimdallarchaeaceae archaeon]
MIISVLYVSFLKDSYNNINDYNEKYEVREAFTLNLHTSVAIVTDKDSKKLQFGISLAIYSSKMTCRLVRNGV